MRNYLQHVSFHIIVNIEIVQDCFHTRYIHDNHLQMKTVSSQLNDSRTAILIG